MKSLLGLVMAYLSVVAPSLSLRSRYLYTPMQRIPQLRRAATNRSSYRDSPYLENLGPKTKANDLIASFSTFTYMRWWSDSAGICHTCSKPLCQSSLAGGPPPQRVWSPAQVSFPQRWGTWSRSVPDDCRRLWTWLSPALRRPDMFPWQRPFLIFITMHK